MKSTFTGAAPWLRLRAEEVAVSLSELSHNARAVITAVRGQGAFRRRLLELGLVPGTVVERAGQAPLGDPLSFRVRGSVISLRRADARSIEIDRVEADRAA